MVQLMKLLASWCTSAECYHKIIAHFIEMMWLTNHLLMLRRLERIIRTRFTIHLTLQRGVSYCYGNTPVCASSDGQTGDLHNLLSAPSNPSYLPTSWKQKLFAKMWHYLLDCKVGDININKNKCCIFILCRKLMQMK